MNTTPPYVTLTLPSAQPYPELETAQDSDLTERIEIIAQATFQSETIRYRQTAYKACTIITLCVTGAALGAFYGISADLASSSLNKIPCCGHFPGLHFGILFGGISGGILGLL